MGASVMTDYGAAYMLDVTFETNPKTFEVVLFTSGELGDITTIAEVPTGHAGYARRKLIGSTGGAFEYQTLAGAVSVVGTGIAAYAFISDKDGADISFTFTGPFTQTEKTVIGYAILTPLTAPVTWANPAVDSAIMYAQLLDNPFTPNNNGDTLTLGKISIRLSKGTVS